LPSSAKRSSATTRFRLVLNGFTMSWLANDEKADYLNPLETVIGAS
jgi:hypothetical protein